MFPQSLRDYMSDMNKSQRGEILRMIARLTKEDNFETAVQSVETALSHRAFDPDSLQALHNRVHNPVLELPPMRLAPSVPKLNAFTPNLEQYDSGLAGLGGEREC